MNRVTFHLPRQVLTSMQWIMLVAMLVIVSFMALATRAEAASRHLQGYYKGQTMSHCGFLENRNVVYAAPSRKNSDKRNTRIIQTKLENAGYSVGKSGADGIYGAQTRRAVARFQNRYHLDADGVVGIETSRMLAYITHPIENVRKCQSLARSRAGR